MSGRSAYVRKTNVERADKRAYKDYSEQDHLDPSHSQLYGYTGPPITRPMYPSNPSYISPTQPPPHIRRRSHSSAGSSYGYPTAPHLHKPRPIVIASAIEKSDFRTHLDGMSSNLRGKLGGLIKGKKELEKPGKQPLRRPGTSTNDSLSTDFEFTSRSTDVTTPSIGALPSLAHSTVPSEGPGTLSSHTSYSLPTREKQKLHQESVIHKIRRFEGGGKLPQLGWKSLSNNPELWDEGGDTFVYMYMRGSRSKPPPSFRVNSQILEQSGSKMFINMLYNIEEPEGWPRFQPYDGISSSRSESSDYHSESYDGFRSPAGIRSDSGVSDAENVAPIGGTKRFMRAPQGIHYEIYVPWPGPETGIHSTIWHITTRNFFAVLYDANSLVGTTLHEALTKIIERLTLYPEYLDASVDKVAFITDFIVRHKFDDVRNNPSYAASLLAFSENPAVQWREGYLEAFVHCVGMLGMGVQSVPEWRYISPHTKIFLSNANMEIEERVHRAQAWLVAFDFSEMWPLTSNPNSSARGCFDRLRKWFCKYYENAFLHWPPTTDQTWLNREMVIRLRNDFYSLYDYLVDRDIMFDGAEYRPGQKWAITSRSGQNFRADSAELPFTDIILTFDSRNEFPHVPYPYPITPTSVPVASKPKASFLFNNNNKVSSMADTVAQTRRKSMSYAEASNVYTLRDRYMHTDLITNFIRFEQSDMVETLDPYEARRSRWLLIYGILQVLATVSVDSPHLRYKEGAQYHLCPQMKGIVPWAERGSPPEEEAEHKLSHCWTIPSTWAPAAPKARPNTHKPILWGQYGDGRVRGESMEVIPTTKQQTTLASSRSELNIGRKRAEEWVANNAGVSGSAMGIASHQRSSSGDDKMMTAEASMQMSVPLSVSMSPSPLPPTTERAGATDSRLSGAKSPSTPSRSLSQSHSQGQSQSPGSEEEDATVRAEAKRRRALVHGFTDFKVPSEW